MLINFKAIRMRKSLLLGFMLPAAAFAQNMLNVNNEAVKIGYHGTGEAMTQSPVRTTGIDRPSNPVNTKLEWLYNAVEIGSTQYDLQVNSALANRITLYDNGEVSVVFTMAQNGSPYLDRGTGYVHFDGKSWSDAPIARLEDDRAGWCNIGTVEKDGKTVEFIVSHFASSDANAKSGGLFIMMNDGIGSSNWSIVAKYKVGENGPFWPRAVGRGNYIHIWTAYNSTAWKPYMGIKRPDSYYRYDVSSDTWLDEKMLMKGYNSDTIAFGQSDSYQMDQDGDNIAIVSGGSAQNLFLFKSDDNGDTWHTTIVDTFPIPYFDGNTNTNGDTLETNTGSVEVLLDKNGKAHVWWNYNRVLDDVDGDSSWSFFPGSNAIIYWNEYTKTPKVVGRALDINGSGQLEISSAQTSVAGGARYSNNTLSCFPDAAIDADGNIYLVYSAPNEDAISPDGPVYRDVYVTYTKDNGETWSDPQPIVEGYETEDVYCHIARNVDDKLHIMWQRDDIAGTAVFNEHRDVVNKIMYAAVDKSIVLNDGLSFGRTGIDENNRKFEVSDAYPNPTSANSYVTLSLENSNRVRVQMTNVMGQEIYNTNLGQLSAGSTTKVELPTSGLRAGIYLYNIYVGETAITGRLVVE
ncbi:T9SS type A sorting domain-containing protein [bacterium]|nr:T9SS type A sorting domain-containing protein [bacterium]